VELVVRSPLTDDDPVTAPPPPGSPEGQPTQLEIFCPDDQAAGVYANGLSSWFTRHDFTLDFLVNLPTQPGQDEFGNPTVRQPLRVVSRVKIPPAILFHLMQNLNQSLTQYEAQFGAIPPDGPPPNPREGLRP
jgi:hypothetical protein